MELRFRGSRKIYFSEISRFARCEIKYAARHILLKKALPKKCFFLVEEDGFAFLRKSRSAALTCHRHVIHYRSPSNPSHFLRKTKKQLRNAIAFLLVEEDGFEPSKSVTTDLQSAPFGRSGTPPGAGDGTRTYNLLITNQLLCQLSYTSILS